MYAPHDYGLLGVVSSIGVIVAALLAMTLPQALLLARTVADQTAVLIAASVVLLSLSFGMSVLLASGETLLPGSAVAQTIATYGWATLSLSALIVANNVVLAWATAHRRYTGAAVLTLGRTVAICVCQLVLANRSGVVSPEGAAFSSGLVTGYVLGELATLIVSAVWFGLGPCRLPRVWPGLALVTGVFRRQRHVMIYGTSREILHAGTVTLPLVAISSIFGPAAAGHFAMASRLLDAPTILIGTAVRTVMMQALNVADATPAMRASLLGTWTARLALPGILLLLAVLFGADWGVRWLLGPGWSETADVLRGIVLWKVLSFCKAPASAWLYATARDKHTAVYQVIGFTAMVVALLASHWLSLGEMTVVAVVAMVGLLIDAWFIGDAFRLSRSDSRQASNISTGHR